MGEKPGKGLGGVFFLLFFTGFLFFLFVWNSDLLTTICFNILPTGTTSEYEITDVGSSGYHTGTRKDRTTYGDVPAMRYSYKVGGKTYYDTAYPKKAYGNPQWDVEYLLILPSVSRIIGMKAGPIGAPLAVVVALMTVPIFVMSLRLIIKETVVEYWKSFMAERRKPSLVKAAARGDIKGVEKLLAGGADVNVKSEEGDSPLHMAAAGGHMKLAEFLADRGADVESKDGKGNTPLLEAVDKGHKDIAELLISRGADVNAKNNNGGNVLQSSAICGDKEMVVMLVEKGADVNIRDNNGWAPLHEAVLLNFVEIVSFLLSSGADVNIKNNDGLTPLHRADNIKVLALLVNNGANVNAKDNEGITPEAWNLSLKKFGIVKALRDYGAK